MNTQTIYEDYASVWNFTKTCLLKGIIDENTFDRKCIEVMDRYARELADGGFLDLAQAKTSLQQYQMNESKAMEDNMYQGRSL